MGIDTPTVGGHFTWDALVDFVEALEKGEHRIWTQNKVQKKGEYAGQIQTEIFYAAPKAANGAPPIVAGLDDEDDVEETEKPKTKKTKK